MADSLNAVFAALGSPARRKILDIVRARPGCSVKHVCGFFRISRIAVMKHLRVLAGAGLVVSNKEGRSRRLYLNCVPIQMIYDRWISQYAGKWASSLTTLKDILEKE